ncbi:hypothetical protein VIN01S_31040 [Vibrio inusitatus NBRC 102082]|uniref:Capsule polysaccharide biosynthesis protein n=1 Tax=Vibrio inusitatus NBRC 102082 TaxID=1219070 RepID=A0A4Y3HZZ4_9VIBR|nr:hypothetical protein [Vibrio inusitatus]GEA52300.1 hypothetical protein VIN01S_31040 [Vibrio inusitatus NBRC 102082]
MIKIIFVENKFKTPLWEAIANRLDSSKIEIHWIVQNPLFSPNTGVVHYLEIPKDDDMVHTNEYDWLENIDRHSYIYNQDTAHYKYYDEKLSSLLDSIKPSVIFGEVTLFHEILLAKQALAKNLLYLHPTTCRYPAGRFCFYKHDTLNPFMGSGETWSENKVKETIEQITTRNVAPDYMLVGNKLTQINKRFRLLKNTLYNILSILWFKEKYNTPKISVKIAKDKEKTIFREKYENIAVKKIGDIDKYAILYPLQLQPESNLDVWGNGYNNQAELIDKLAKQNKIVYIKPNPKSKYEVNQDLVDTIRSNTNVVALSHDIKMDDIFPYFNTFFSPTGTINIEAILSNKVCYSPVFPLTNKFTNNYRIPTVDDIEHQSSTTEIDKRKLMQELISTSYVGKIGDIIHAPEVLKESNLDRIVFAFNLVIDSQKPY